MNGILTSPALERFAGNRRLQQGIAAVLFLAISLVFFNKIFTSDYGIHLSIGKHFVETRQVPDREFLIYPLAGQPMNFEELGFQAILYAVYSLVGSNGVSVFVWLMATGAYFFIYRALRVRGINAYVALFTLLVFAMPFRIRLQPRPEIIAYFFCGFLMYGCSLYYYGNNRRIIYFFPLVFLVWSNIHPSTLAGLATVGAYGTQSLVIAARDRFEKESLKRNLLIPLGVFALCFLATFLSKHGLDSLLTPIRLVTNPAQTSGISEMTSIKNSGFYEYYRFIFAMTVGFGLLGLAAWRLRIHDVIMAVYGLKLPLQVARGMAFMSVFCVPIVAQGFDGLYKRLRDWLVEKEEAARRASAKAAREKEGASRKKGARKGTGAASETPPAGNDAPGALPAFRRLRVPVLVAWLGFLGVVGYGAWYIRVGTVDLVENGIGLTEHKFSLKSAEFLRGIDLKGNLFNFFDLGGFVDWQLYPEKKAFIDGRAGNPSLFMEHQTITSAIGNIDSLFRKYNITCILTKAVDSSGMVLPLVEYLANSPDWELVFADGLAIVFVRNIPDNAEIIRRNRLPKGIIRNEVISELIHSTYLGVNKVMAYHMAGNLFMQGNDVANARRFFQMAYDISKDPGFITLLNQLDAMGRPR